MHLILTGATGLVGSGVLNQMLSMSAVNKISILSRKPVPMAQGHVKVEVIIHDDFEKYDEAVLEQLKGAEGCVWALGTSVNNVSKEDYVKIHVDYALAAAKAFSGLADLFKFVYVSGEGATTTPGMLTPYFGRIKGNTEAALLALSNSNSSFKAYSVRPGGVDPANDPDIHPFRPSDSGVVKAVSRVIYPAFRVIYPSMMSPTEMLGRVFTELAMGDGEPQSGKGVSGEGRTLSNVALRRLGGL